MIDLHRFLLHLELLSFTGTNQVGEDYIRYHKLWKKTLDVLFKACLQKSLSLSFFILEDIR